MKQGRRKEKKGEGRRDGKKKKGRRVGKREVIQRPLYFSLLFFNISV